jgi:hypothetical protein
MSFSVRMTNDRLILIDVGNRIAKVRYMKNITSEIAYYMTDKQILTLNSKLNDSTTIDSAMLTNKLHIIRYRLMMEERSQHNRDAVINSTLGRYIRRMMTRMIREGFYFIIRYLVEYGFELQHMDIYFAVNIGNIEMARYLIQNSNIELKPELIQAAISNRHYEMLGYLLQLIKTGRLEMMTDDELLVITISFGIDGYVLQILRSLISYDDDVRYKALSSPIYVTDRVLNIIAENNYVVALQLIAYEQPNIKFDRWVIISAIRNDSVEIIEWLYENRRKYTMNYTSSMVKYARDNDIIQMLNKWRS